MDEKPRSRWFRYRLRTLLVLIAVLSPLLISGGRWLRERNQKYYWMEERGRLDFFPHPSFGRTLAEWRQIFPNGKLHVNVKCADSAWRRPEDADREGIAHEPAPAEP